MMQKILPVHKNNFDFLRLAAAEGVILYHSYLFLGREGADPLQMLTGWKLNEASLAIFFLISGYLVTASFQKHAGDYWRNRFLRIFPALFVNVVLTAFVFGAIYTNLSAAEYFSRGETYRYLLNLLILPLPLHLPGVFTGNDEGRIVNGSLWTLGSEVLLYFYLWMFECFGLNFKKAVPLALAIFVGLQLAGFNYYMHKIGDVLFTAYPNFEMACFFFIGGAVQVFKIKTDKTPVLILLFCASAVSAYCKFYELSLFLLLPYFIFYFAFNKKIKLWHAAKYGDFSYGIYIYAWIVEQVMVENFAGITPLRLFIYSSMIALALAFASWHLIEKRALALKFTPRS